ncbi:TPA: MBL fold hydrolase, partial [Enterococcus faecalis]|nr:MBL fold hydrolase [Enterococcus faecalis]
MRKDNNSSISTKTSNEEENIMYKKIQGIDATYLIMNPDPVFGSTATIIEKNGKGLLVDTQFSKKDADKIVQLVKSNNIDIETIYISYSDPDYYFGTNQIKKSFPKANVVATASTISRIKDTYKSKLSVWADTLKENAPDKIIIPNEIKESIN